MGFLRPNKVFGAQKRFRCNLLNPLPALAHCVKLISSLGYCYKGNYVNALYKTVVRVHELMNSIMMLYSAFMSSALVIALFLSLSVTRISRCYAPEILGPAGTWVYTNYVFVTDRWTENLKSRNC